MAVSKLDEDRLAAAAAGIPPADFIAEETDLIPTLLTTVVDFQTRTAVVNRAMEHFRSRRAAVRTLEDFEALLAGFPDDKQGNTALAETLWGYRLWTRAGILRGLVRFVADLGVENQAELRAWAAGADFRRDFEGKVRGLGRGVFQGLLMRLGVDTVKPDVHLKRFTEAILGRRLTDEDVVAVVTGAARSLGIRASELDWAIWEHQQSLRA